MPAIAASSIWQVHHGRSPLQFRAIDVFILFFPLGLVDFILSHHIEHGVYLAISTPFIEETRLLPSKSWRSPSVSMLVHRTGRREIAGQLQRPRQLGTTGMERLPSAFRLFAAQHRSLNISSPWKQRDDSKHVQVQYAAGI